MYIDYIGLCCDSVGWDRTPEEVDKVNSASGEERENLRNEGYKGNAEEWLENHARNIEQAYNLVSAPKVKSKYTWLGEYHNEVASKYTDKAECFCEFIE